MGRLFLPGARMAGQGPAARCTRCVQDPRVLNDPAGNPYAVAVARADAALHITLPAGVIHLSPTLPLSCIVLTPAPNMIFPACTSPNPLDVEIAHARSGSCPSLRFRVHDPDMHVTLLRLSGRRARPPGKRGFRLRTGTEYYVFAANQMGWIGCSHGFRFECPAVVRPDVGAWISRAPCPFP